MPVEGIFDVRPNLTECCAGHPRIWYDANVGKCPMCAMFVSLNSLNEKTAQVISTHADNVTQLASGLRMVADIIRGSS